MLRPGGSECGVRRPDSVLVEGPTAPSNGQDDEQRRFLFVLGSSRLNGNSEALARLAAAKLPAGIPLRWVRLLDLDLPQFDDIRHSGDGIYPLPETVGRDLLQATLWASDLVMVVPLYWYSLPARAKNYLDHWSGWLRLPGVAFRERMAGKTMWLVSAASGGDPSLVRPLLGTLQLTAQYMRMNWGGSLFGLGNSPAEVLHDGNALDQAAAFFNGPGQLTAQGDLVRPAAARSMTREQVDG